MAIVVMSVGVVSCSRGGDNISVNEERLQKEKYNIIGNWDFLAVKAEDGSFKELSGENWVSFRVEKRILPVFNISFLGEKFKGGFVYDRNDLVTLLVASGEGAPFKVSIRILSVNNNEAICEAWEGKETKSKKTFKLIKRTGN